MTTRNERRKELKKFLQYCRSVGLEKDVALIIQTMRADLPHVRYRDECDYDPRVTNKLRIEFKENPGCRLDDGDKVGIYVYNGMNGNVVLEIELMETHLNRHGDVYLFGQKIAGLLPKLNIQYRSRHSSIGRETIQRGWYWARGNPRFLTSYDREKIKETERLLLTYFRCLKIDACVGLTNEISAAMSSLYDDGITNPVLLAGLSIVVGNGWHSRRTIRSPGEELRRRSVINRSIADATKCLIGTDRTFRKYRDRWLVKRVLRRMWIIYDSLSGDRKIDRLKETTGAFETKHPELSMLT